MLSSYRVLDLTDERGQLAGAMLAGLGAEVILVEPPGGSHSRRVGPWCRRDQHRERSLSHWVHNRGKHSVVLDLARSETDRDALRRLAAGADVLIESSTPGEMAALGLDDQSLREINPALVYVSITPFGSHGPKARWPATDLTAWASAMVLAVTGDADQPPVRISLPQAFLHASADAAGGALLALSERARSGLGQHVDVSAQASSLLATQSYVLSAPLGATTPTRSGGGARMATVELRLVWPCRDGDVAIMFAFGSAIGPFTGRLMEWICEEGFCTAETRDTDWVGFGARMLARDEDALTAYEGVKRVVEAFTLTKTKQELFDAARARRLVIAPVSGIDDLVTSEQLDARCYWTEVDDDAISPRPLRVPGPFAKLTVTPMPALGCPPRLGEHSTSLSAAPRLPAHLPEAPDRSGDLPLAGLKVLDLMWVLAGPAMTRVLADFGATVVRVESATSVDTARTAGPFLEDVNGDERSGCFANMNAGKLGVSLNLAEPDAREVFSELIRWADVVTESFSPRMMPAWGYSYEQLRAINPSIVMLSSSLMGQTGPLADFAGYGNLAAAIGGFTAVTGWPNRPPAGPFFSYTDYVSPRFALAALLAALDHRRRTGEGQHIDVSQTEASLHFLAPAILDYAIDGHVFERSGNRDPDMVPHGVYPAAGDDAWVAVACRTDEEWHGLCRLIGRDDLAEDATLRTLPGRVARITDLDGIVADWTARRSADDASECCRRIGVPAHAVFSSAECVADPQLGVRQHFVEVQHAASDTITVEGPRILLSRTPGRAGAVPTLGQHTWEILQQTLGYDEQHIVDLYARGVLD